MTTPPFEPATPEPIPPALPAAPTPQGVSGTTVTVGLDSTTAYHQQVAASASHMQAGRTVILRPSGGFRPNDNKGTGGPASLGTASDVTVVP